MSFFERYVNSKLYQYTDIFFKIMLLNFYMIITIICGFFIIGIPVATAAGATTLSLILKKTSTEVTSTYFTLLRKTYRKVMVKGIVLEILIALLGFNVVFFYYGLEPFSLYYVFGFIISLWMLLFTIIAFYHTMILSIIYDVKWVSIIKHGYLLTIGFGLRSIAAITMGILYTLLVIWIPILSALVGFSGALLLAFWLLNKPYQQIETLKQDFNESLESYFK